LAAWPERGVQDRAGRDAGEDALELEQLADPRTASRGPTLNRESISDAS
jgi:hypothetical protein